MRATEYIHPNMVAEFAYSPAFALKMKAFNYLDCRNLGMTPSESQALYGVTEEIANEYGTEWAYARGYERQVA